MAEECVQYRRPPGLSGVELLRLNDSTMEMQPHFHDGYVVWFNGSGAEQYSLPGERGILQPDSFSIVEPGEVHGNSGADGKRTLLSLYIEEEAVRQAGESLFDGFSPGGFRTGVYRDPGMKRLLTALHGQLWQERESMSGRGAFLQLIAKLFERYGSLQPKTSVSSESSKLIKAQGFMRERLAEPLQLVDVAVHCGCTEYHLIRIFRHGCGLTPHAYLMKLRAEEARRLLTLGHSIVETACLCGFTDQSHLTRHFRRRFGLPPGRYLSQVNYVQDTGPISR